MTPYSPALRKMVEGLLHVVHYPRRAYAIIYGMVQQQAVTLAFIDTIWLLAVGCAILTPLAFLMRRAKPGAAMMH